MKNYLAAAAALVVTLAPVALADGMDNVAGQTVRVTFGEDGFDAWFGDDGSYSDSRGVAGSWTLDSELCIHVETEQGTASNCGPWNPDLMPGESWSTTGWSEDGSAITIEILAH